MPRTLRRPIAVLAVIGLLLIPGGIVTAASAALSAVDQQTLKEQQALLDPEAPVGDSSDMSFMDHNAMSAAAAQSVEAHAVSAVNTPAQVVTEPAVGGRWSRLKAFPANTNAYHMIMGPGGKILLIAGSGNNAQVFKAGTFKAYIWSPAAGIQKQISVPTDMFCSGHMLLSDGRGLAAGGSANYSPWKGEKAQYTFDFKTEKFTRQKDMTHGRWYPTIINSPGGQALIVGGFDETGKNSGTSEVFFPKTNTQANVTGTQIFPLYPQIFSTSDRRYFYTGEGWSNAPNDNVIHAPGLWDTTSNAFTAVKGLTNATQRGSGASCRVGDTRNQDIVIMGGGWPATNSVNLINLNAATPVYQVGPNLPAAKAYVSCVELPDGTLMEVNGGSANRIANYSREVSLLTSAKATVWKALNPSPYLDHRLYHSAAFLMDDGSVVTFGSNPGAGDARSNSVTRYEPPYMFKGSRPTLSTVPTTMTYGKTYTLKVSADVTKVAIMTPPSPTHSTDANQKQLILPVVNGKITLYFDAYDFGRSQVRLFALNAKGVPSTAKWSQIQ